MLLLLCIAQASAVVITIGSGHTINQSLPWEPVLNYNYSQMLYLASEINSAGVVTGIGFSYTVYSPLFLERNRNITVFMGHCEEDSLVTWVPYSSLTQVFSGELTAENFSSVLPGAGTMTIPLSIPFSYDGQRNLIIAIDENSPGGSNSSDDFYCTASYFRRACRYSNQNINPDPADPPLNLTANSTYFPNLRLDMQVISYAPSVPSPANQSTGIAIDTGLSWASDAGSFDVYFGTNPAALSPVSLGTSLHSWIPTEPLQYLTTYYWKVIAASGTNLYPGPIWSFTTTGETITAPRNLSGYWNGEAVSLTWQAPQTGTPSSYRIYRNSAYLSQTLSTGYQDSTVNPGNTYFYNVSALNPQGQESPFSNSISVSIPSIDPTLILEDTCEGYTPFSNELGSWLNFDRDGSQTWTLEGHSFPGAGDPSAWISFFPAQTSPPLTSLTPHSGIGMLACFNSLTPPNNDWLISPRIALGTNPSLKLYARSHTADFGLERLRILISPGTTEFQSFTPISTEPYIEVPASWTELSYNLSSWQGQTVRIAFQCLSWDALALYLDDITIRGTGGSSTSDPTSSPPAFSLCPNPSRGAFRLVPAQKQSFDLNIYDLRGREVFRKTRIESFDSLSSGFAPEPGVYLIRAKTASQIYRAKIVILP